MRKSLEKYNSSELSQEESESINNPVSIKETEYTI